MIRSGNVPQRWARRSICTPRTQWRRCRYSRVTTCWCVRCGAGAWKPARMRCVLYPAVSFTVTQRQSSCSATSAKRCRSCFGVSTAARNLMAGPCRSRLRSTSRKMSGLPSQECTTAHLCAARSMHWGATASCSRPIIPLTRKAPARSWIQCRWTKPCVRLSPTIPRRSYSTSLSAPQSLRGLAPRIPLCQARKCPPKRGDRVKPGHDDLASLRLDHPDRFAVEPGSNILEDVGKVFPVVLLADISEMRRDHDIVELAKRMIERQRLDLEYVEAGAGNRLFS